MKSNAIDRKEIESGHVAVNSIQREVYVKRMQTAYQQFRSIYSYDVSNLYPQIADSIAQRSWALSTALKTYTDFIRGDGFENEALMTLEVNSEGATLFDILRFIAKDKSKYGFALHFNYDLAGRITEINPLNFMDIRVKKDGGLRWCEDWSDMNKHRTAIDYMPFNPEAAPGEIREQGLDKYTGQVFYWKGTKDVYPLATFDSVIDAGQYQAEAELYKLSNVQNGFSLGGVFTYPQQISGEKELQDIKKELKGEATGGKNAGRILTIGIPASIYNEGGANVKWFQTFERNNIDNLFTQQNNEAREAIFACFRQPPVLNAISETGMFNQQSLQDAFTYYNSIVEEDRKDVERAIEKILANSIWGEQDVRIKPKMLIENEGTGVSDDRNRPDND